MSNLSSILSGFYDALNTNELSWADIRVGPVDPEYIEENNCYIEPGEEIAITESSQYREYRFNVYIAFQRASSLRTDMAGIEEGCKTLDLILDSVDSYKPLQQLCNGIAPLQNQVIYTDKEGMQSVKYVLIYDVRYRRLRKRAK